MNSFVKPNENNENSVDNIVRIFMCNKLYQGNLLIFITYLLNIKITMGNHKKPFTKSTRAIIWFPFPYRFFKTVKGLGIF